MNIKGNMPIVNLLGVKDNSTTVAPPSLNQEPQHCPYFHLNTYKGDPENAVQVNTYSDAVNLFGAETFDPRGPYYNHVTAYVKALLDLGNACIIRRSMRPSSVTLNAQGQTVITNPPATAGLVCFVELDTLAPFYPYLRDANGNVQVDINGVALKDPINVAPSGVTLKVHLRPQGALSDAQLANPVQTAAYQILGDIAVDSNVIASAALVPEIVVGMTVSSDAFPAGTKITAVDTVNRVITVDQPSTLTATAKTFIINGNVIYPVFKIPALFPGVSGDVVGFKMWNAFPGTPQPADPDVIADQGTLLYNIMLLLNNGSAGIYTTSDLNGSVITVAGFKPKTYDFKTNQDLVLSNLYSNFNSDGISNNSAPIYGPVANPVIFYDNLNTLLDLMLVAENSLNPVPVTSKWMLDFLTGYNSAGVLHYGVQISADSDIINQNTTTFLSGGNDGDLTNTTYERGVLTECTELLMNLNHPLRSSVLFPYSEVYDVGYSLPVKKVLPYFTAIRKNVRVTLGTYIIGEDPLTADQEVSVGAAILGAARLFNESDVYSTPAFRSTIFGQCATPINSDFTEKLPLTYQAALSRARFAGNGLGQLLGKQNYTIPPNNQIVDMIKVSSPNLGVMARENMWANCINYAIPFSKNSMFWPAVQTIYADVTSVLVDDVTSGILCNIELLMEQTWSLMVGRSDLTDAEFIVESNNTFNRLAANKYAGLVVVTPNTYYTPDDMIKGYKWTMVVNVAANKAKTVGDFSIVVTRLKSK